MVERLLQSFQEAGEPQLEKKSVLGNPYEEGKNLPASISEDVGSFSLHPAYSKRQLRRINRLKVQAKIASKKNLEKLLEESL